MELGAKKKKKEVKKVRGPTLKKLGTFKLVLPLKRDVIKHNFNNLPSKQNLLKIDSSKSLTKSVSFLVPDLKER